MLSMRLSLKLPLALSILSLSSQVFVLGSYNLLSFKFPFVLWPPITYILSFTVQTEKLSLATGILSNELHVSVFMS